MTHNPATGDLRGVKTGPSVLWRKATKEMIQDRPTSHSRLEPKEELLPWTVQA